MLKTIKKISFISFMFFILSNSSNIVAKEKETIEFIDCSKNTFLEKEFSYPVKIMSMEQFELGSVNKYIMYKMTFLIDRNFKFPKKKLKTKFIPFKSKNEEIDCVTDVFPKHYKEIKKKNNKYLNLYLENDDYYKLKIYISKSTTDVSFE